MTPRSDPRQYKARGSQSRTPIRQAVIDAFKAKGRASVQAHRAIKASQPSTSWWLCPPDQFAGEAKKAADRMNTSSTSYQRSDQEG
jgi:hypothetical protein